jgi:3-oxoacyl-[acyl-carrier-protein] synthase II
LYWAGRPARGTRAALRAILPAAHADTLGDRLGLYGPRESIVAACSSGAVALAAAADLIVDGVTPFALAGGVDALTRICFMGFNALRLLDPAPCRPFDRDRRGMSIGEGAAFVLLEDAAHAAARGARAWAELRGYGMTTDAFHATSPHPTGEGMVRAMRGALAAARAEPGEIGYVNAHGTSTPLNDLTEARVLNRVLGDRPLVTSTKGVTGHLIGAAGALSAMVCLLAMRDGVLPPTINLERADPDCDLDYVPLRARSASVRMAVVNAFGFGGQNCVLVVGAGPG